MFFKKPSKNLSKIRRIFGAQKSSIFASYDFSGIRKSKIFDAYEKFHFSLLRNFQFRKHQTLCVWVPQIWNIWRLTKFRNEFWNPKNIKNIFGGWRKSQMRFSKRSEIEAFENLRFSMPQNWKFWGISDAPNTRCSRAPKIEDFGGWRKFILNFLNPKIFVKNFGGI